MATYSRQSRPLTWMADHWPKATAFLAIYSLILLYLFLFEDHFLLFLIWLQTPVYWLHEFEEYIYPGGFAKFFNRDLLGSSKDDWPLTKIASLWINIPIIFIAFPLSAILAGIYGLGLGIWTAYFSIFNALCHVGIFLKFGYNPGFVVSLLLNIPIGIYAIYTLISAGVISTTENIIGALIAFSVQAGLMVWGLGFMRRRIQKEKA